MWTYHCAQEESTKHTGCLKVVSTCLFGSVSKVPKSADFLMACANPNFFCMFCSEIVSIIFTLRR